MAKVKKPKKIRRPRGAVNPPEAKAYQEFEEFQAPKVDKKKALREWFAAAKNDTMDDSSSNSCTIDPKQAFYETKRKVSNEKK